MTSWTDSYADERFYERHAVLLMVIGVVFGAAVTVLPYVRTMVAVAQDAF